MKQFLTKILFFITTFCILSFVLYLAIMHYYGLQYDSLSLLRLSNSFSYNEKMRFIQKRKINYDVLAIGSSMTLNNLNSKVIKEQLQNNSYLNAGSWGMSIKDDFELLNLLAKTKLPKVLIISSNISDFQEEDKKVDFALLGSYLRNEKELEVIIKTFSLSYIFDNLGVIKNYSNIKEYNNLLYDNNGAVNFKKDGFNVNRDRWNRHFVNNKLNPMQYKYLDSISKFCTANQIRFVFVQTPFRNGVYGIFNSFELAKLNTHTEKVNQIITQNKQSFINCNKSGWNDSLFVDATHLNEVGAVQFTKYVFDELQLDKQK